jgi:hypothetical protein
VRKRTSRAPFHTENDDFTKTGSGQTGGKLKKEMRFSPRRFMASLQLADMQPSTAFFEVVGANACANERTNERTYFSFWLSQACLGK